MTPQAQRFISGPESPLEGIHRDAWQRFVAVLEVQPIDAVSESGGLGSYDVRPRRLVELGYASGLCRTKAESGVRQVQTCNFVLPWTQARFLADPIAQYVALSRSMSLYHRALSTEDLKRPNGVSVAEALVILHIAGVKGLERWDDFSLPNTRVRVAHVKGCF